MIIAISGSVGSGKTTIAKKLLKKLNEEFEKETITALKQRKYELIHLNELAIKYKLKDVKELQTFDFDLDKLVFEMNKFLEDTRNENISGQFEQGSNSNKDKNLILEGHFAHFLNPDLVDYLFVISRDLKELQEEYKVRDYNQQKIKDNLEVESFNLCFYEALEEGFKEENQVFAIDNSKKLDEVVDNVVSLIKK